MKHAPLIVFLSISSVLSSQSIIDQGNYWLCTDTYRQTSNDMAFPNLWEFLVEGDTIVNDTLYSKLWLRYARSLWGSSDYELIAGLRTESSDSLVYMRAFFDTDSVDWSNLHPCESESEFLLYDFTRRTDFDHCSGTAYVDSEVDITLTDTVLTGVEMHFWTHLGPSYVVLGIGSTSGLLSPLQGEFENFLDLHCFTNGDVTIDFSPLTWYELRVFESCDWTTSITNLYLKDFRYGPNPSSHNLEVSGVSSGDILIISDMLGIPCLVLALSDGEENIDISQLSNGQYLLFVYSGEQRYFAGKLMILH